MVLDLHAKSREAVGEQRVVLHTAQFGNPGKDAQRVLRQLGAADMDALKPQQRLGDAPAIVQAADKIAERRAHRIEKDLVEFLVAGKILDRANANPGCRQIYQNEADSGLLPGCFCGACEHDDVGRIMRERSPCFLPGDHKFIAIDDGFGAQRGEVRTRIRLGIALAPDVLAVEDVRQKAAALLLGAETDQHRPDHQYAVVLEARDTPALLLFKKDQQFARRQAHAAVLRRPVGREPADPGHASVPVTVLAPAQPARGIAQVAGIMRLELRSDQRAKRFVGQCVPVLVCGCIHALSTSSGGAR